MASWATVILAPRPGHAPYPSITTVIQNLALHLSKGLPPSRSSKPKAASFPPLTRPLSANSEGSHPWYAGTSVCACESLHLSHDNVNAQKEKRRSEFTVGRKYIV